MRFLSENFVNNVEDFPIGIIKHGIMCLDNGWIATHGILLRTGEQEYEAYWHAPFINYAHSLKPYDCELVDITAQRYMFQMQGPRCLEILEQVTGDDLHDIEYRHFRQSSIDGHPVRILRFGMAGTLGYEIHGEIEHAREVFKKIAVVGNPMGRRLMGITSYAMTHIAGGFVQANRDFVSAGFADPGFMAYTQALGAGEGSYAAMKFEILGSAGPDMTKHFYNPIEIGLGRAINWKHEFRGKAALEEYKRNVVTLEWDPEDIVDVYASQFRQDEEPYHPMDTPGGMASTTGHVMQYTDLVLNAEGEEIGLSMGRTQYHYGRVMLSSGSLDREYRELGTEVFVLWGNPGTRQKRIRAKVTPFPYRQENTNETFDVETIPHPVVRQAVLV